MRSSRSARWSTGVARAIDRSTTPIRGKYIGRAPLRRLERAALSGKKPDLLADLFERLHSGFLDGLVRIAGELFEGRRSGSGRRAHFTEGRRGLGTRLRIGQQQAARQRFETLCGEALAGGVDFY